MKVKYYDIKPGANMNTLNIQVVIREAEMSDDIVLCIYDGKSVCQIDIPRHGSQIQMVGEIREAMKLAVGELIQYSAPLFIMKFLRRGNE